MAQRTLEQAKRELSDLLDAAEKGEVVVVVRDEHRFRLTLIPPERAVMAAPSPIAVDPEVLEGNWTWGTGADGQLEFRPRGETP